MLLPMTSIHQTDRSRPTSSALARLGVATDLGTLGRPSTALAPVTPSKLNLKSRTPAQGSSSLSVPLGITSTAAVAAPASIIQSPLLSPPVSHSHTPLQWSASPNPPVEPSQRPPTASPSPAQVALEARLRQVLNSPLAATVSVPSHKEERVNISRSGALLPPSSPSPSTSSAKAGAVGKWAQYRSTPPAVNHPKRARTPAEVTRLESSRLMSSLDNTTSSSRPRTSSSNVNRSTDMRLPTPKAPLRDVQLGPPRPSWTTITTPSTSRVSTSARSSTPSLNSSGPRATTPLFQSYASLAAPAAPTTPSKTFSFDSANSASIPPTPGPLNPATTRPPLPPSRRLSTSSLPSQPITAPASRALLSASLGALPPSPALHSSAAARRQLLEFLDEPVPGQREAVIAATAKEPPPLREVPGSRGVAGSRGGVASRGVLSSPDLRTLPLPPPSASDGVEDRLEWLRQMNSKFDQVADLDIVHTPGPRVFTSAGEQAAAMVLSLENPLESTPEVLELELDHMNTDQLQMMQSMISKKLQTMGMAS